METLGATGTAVRELLPEVRELRNLKKLEAKKPEWRL